LRQLLLDDVADVLSAARVRRSLVANSSRSFAKSIRLKSTVSPSA
jgi:hypothetical protein